MSGACGVDRREFLKRAGFAGSALVLSARVGWAECLTGSPAGLDGGDQFEPNVHVRIGDDGLVRLTVHRTELGQGARTSCAMLIAEELDVDLGTVVILQAPGDARFGPQHTAGSSTVRLNWTPLRQAGAAAREMLVAAAAKTWGVPVQECRTGNGAVVHPESGRQTPYGDLVAIAATLPVPDEPRLKSPDQFRIIGRPHSQLDAKDMLRGTAIYGWDVELDDLLYASIERSPTVRGTVARYAAGAAREVRDVVDVIELKADASGLTNNGIAVVARNTWAALQGRAALDAEWEHGPLPPENSEEYRAALEAIGTSPGRVVRREGDYAAARAQADRVIEARYHGPYLVHAPMEPPACTARFDGRTCEVWSPTQAPQWTRSAVAAALGIPEEDVTVHVTLVGGAFGRKSKPDFAVEAALLSRNLGAPVKVAWTREDEIRHGFYRAQNFQYLQATIGADGTPTGWFHRTVFPAIGWNFAGPRGPGESELAQGMSNMPYRFPNLRLEAGSVASSLRIGWMRSVCNTFHSFAVNSFMDELAHEIGRDPVAFHLEMLGEPRILEFTEADRRNPYKFDTGRLGRVMAEAAEMAGWGRALPERRGLGFAAQYSFMSYVAMVAHVSVAAEGALRVHEIDCALDCGPVLNPDMLEAQIQGAVAMGLSLALYGSITVRDGTVEQGNYDDYPIVRMAEMPTVNVRAVPTGDVLPTGIGEPGVPPTAPAVANAIFAATGRRIRDLPLAGQDLG